MFSVVSLNVLFGLVYYSIFFGYDHFHCWIFIVAHFIVAFSLLAFSLLAFFIVGIFIVAFSLSNFHCKNFHCQIFIVAIFIVEFSLSNFHCCHFHCQIFIVEFFFIVECSLLHHNWWQIILDLFASTQMLGPKYLDVNPVTNVHVSTQSTIGTSEHSFKSVDEGR